MITNYELVIHKELRNKPATISSVQAQVWTIRQNSNIRVNLVEMKGKLSLHKHPDADHSIMVFEGSLIATVGDKEITLKKGDFLTIPRNIPHKYQTITPVALIISMDAPYYDPKKTIALE